jgi:hypothetical protein
VYQLWILAGATIWIADAHRGDGQRFVVRADEKADRLCQARIDVRGELS